MLLERGSTMDAGDRPCAVSEVAHPFRGLFDAGWRAKKGKAMPDIKANASTKARFETDFGDPVIVGSFSDRLEKAGDHDWIKVELIAGPRYDFTLALFDEDSDKGDAYLVIRDASGNIATNLNGDVPAEDDDDGGDNNAHIAFVTGTTGTYYIDVGSFENAYAGEYSLSLWRLERAALSAFDTDAADISTSESGFLAGGRGSDALTARDALGEQGNDVLIGAGNNANYLSGGMGHDTLYGFSQSDWLFGDAGHDEIRGGTGDDQTFGGADNDRIFGDDGQDRIVGGLARDTLWGGGDPDTFIFRTTKESVVGKLRDIIRDFSSLDYVDVSAIDANSQKDGDQAFKWIGGKPFGHHAGEIHFRLGILSGDVNGDGKPDFDIDLGNADFSVGQLIP
jgi:Ca2+-binding RTX toxin-like protein